MISDESALAASASPDDRGAFITPHIPADSPSDPVVSEPLGHDSSASTTLKHSTGRCAATATLGDVTIDGKKINECFTLFVS
jgi:hypothetical protein